MKLNIAPKLFLGFLGIILLNLFFVVIVGRLTDLNTIAKILKRQNEVKNQLLRVENFHVAQTRSRFIYNKIGKQKYADNFNEMGQSATLLIDTVVNELSTVLRLDSLVSEDGSYDSDLQRLIATVSTDVKENNRKYNDTFDQLTKVKAGWQTKVGKKERDYLNEVLDTSDLNFRDGLAVTDSLIDQQTMSRIKEIESRVDNVKRVTMIIVIGISILAILFGLFFSRAITNSLRRLSESASTIGKGEFDFDPKGYPKDEIGDLANAFFEMAYDLKRTQDELIRSKRLAAIGEIVASVNHEINNPLMIISGNAQFLEMSMDGYPEEMKERVRAILEETDRISQVTRKLREIKNPITEDYTSSGEQMINLDKSAT